MSRRLEYTPARVAQARLDLRDEAESILAMSTHLDRAERILVEQVYRDGLAVTDIARLYRVNPRTMQNRLKKAIKRIASPEFQYVLTHGELLPRELRAPARRFYLQGLGLRRTAELTQQSLHTVRQQRLRLDTHLDAHLRRSSTTRHR
ncbi:MAG: hypothetical protein AAGG38_12520 [Planctomycetota bacterium]